MRIEWKKRELEEVCSVDYGTRVVQKRDGGSIYPVYGGGGATFFMDTFNRENQMVIARFAMSEQCTRFVEGKFFLNDSGLTVSPKDNKVLFQKFLDYQLLFLNDYIYSLSRGAAQKNLDVPAFRTIEIAFPESTSEQKRVATILDNAFVAMDKAKINIEKNLENARGLFESFLKCIFFNEDWEQKTLKQVSSEFSRGKSKHRPRGDMKLLGGKYPLIQTGDVSNSEHWINTYSQTYNEVGLGQSKLWPKGTVCIAIVGSNVAETSILNFNACFPDSIIGLVVDKQKANNEYVEYLLQSFKTILKEKGKGTARDNINVGTFENQNFPFPNVEIQEEIAANLNGLSTNTKNLESIYYQKLADLEELKKSILQKAFSGQLSESGLAGLKDEQDVLIG
jgi:type I restriction enzyme S subunit